LTARGRSIAGVRVLTTLFFLATSLYCCVVASAFAYHQFIRPGLFGWLVWGRNQYDALFLGMFSVTLLSLLPDLSEPASHESRWVRRLALGFVAVWGPVALALFAYPVLALRGSEGRSLLIAAVVLAPAAWLAVLDHLASWRDVFRDNTVTVSSEARVFAAAGAAAFSVWAVYGGVSAVRAAAASSLDAAWWFGAAGSLLIHVAAFAAIAWALAAIVAAARWARSGGVEYGLALAMFAAWLFFLMQLSVLPALALRGAAPTLVAAAFALTVTASWSGIALRLAASDRQARTGLDLFFRLLAPPVVRGGTVLWLALLPVVAYAALSLSALADWGFLVQKIGVLMVWQLAWATMFVAVRSTRSPSRSVVVGCSLAVLAAYHGARIVEGRATSRELPVLVDRYATYDASFKTLDDALATRPETTPAFYRYLAANANVDDSVPIAPARIDFGPRLALADRRPRPHIFLFVLDSLRPDYLSAYNPAVTFTPRIGAFAAESLVFRNAFSRYGGTGLSVPAIFSGSLLPHRQYVMPFAPMNGLGRLLEDEHYRFVMSPDSVVTQLGMMPTGTVELATGERQMSGDMCTMLTDLERTLDGARSAPDPLFTYALPQNLHLAYVLRQPPPAERYPGFHAPVAAQLRRLDTCFGAFIEGLKARGLFDQSLIILTSDHGDSLGEEGRFGHFYAGFPEIFRIPLVIHLPAEMAGRWDTDLTAVSFATDIAPTIHALLGGEVDARGRMFGTPLVRRPGTPGADRRGQEFLLASSYGPVYGLLTQNGRRLYVVDTINARDYSFDLTTGAAGSRLPTTAAERRLGQQRIAEQIAEIAAFFDFDPQP
jgi:hypothetical protein